MNDQPTPTPPHGGVYAIVFLLSLTEFLQAGMTAFAAAPIMGGTRMDPEEFSLVAAVYASVAILSISMQRWFVERIGGRRFVQATALVFVAGAAITATSGSFPSFLLGRAVMGLGGGAFFTACRMIIQHVLAGPRRFVGIRSLATGLAMGIAGAPWLASIAVSGDTWPAMYWLLAVLGAAILVLAGFTLPKAPLDVARRSEANPWHQLLLVGASFTLLYSLQRFYYDFPGNAAPVALALAAAVAGLWFYLHRQHVHERPLLRVRELANTRYRFGLGLFFFAYLMLGANNQVIPSMLQGSLGHGWATVARVEALGLGVALLTWWVLERTLPRFPSPRKFLVTGFIALATSGLLLSRLTPDADVWLHVLPALACNSIFLLTVLPVTAMQTFREVEQDESVFSNAQQLKNMMSQVGIALGITLATIGQQWRVAFHYTDLSAQVTPSNPVYVETVQRIQEVFAASVPASDAARLAVAQVAQMLARQSAMLANIDHFLVVAGLGLQGMGVVATQRVFR